MNVYWLALVLVPVAKEVYIVGNEMVEDELDGSQEEISVRSFRLL